MKVSWNLEQKQNVKWTSLNSLKKKAFVTNQLPLKFIANLIVDFVSFFWSFKITAIQTKNANSKQSQWANDILLEIIYLIFNYTQKSFERQRQKRRRAHIAKWRLLFKMKTGFVSVVCCALFFFLFICHILANELISSEWLIQVHSAFSQLYCFFLMLWCRCSTSEM